MNPKLVFYGGVGTATGANIGLFFGGKKLLVDCGLLQGLREEEDKNFEPFSYNPAEFEYLLVTHAHMDHIGKIPKLVRDGFRGKIISTEETLELAKVSLADALKVMKSRHPDKILFEESDIEQAISLWQGYKYGEEIKLFENCTVRMTNSGHILGSAVMLVSCGAGSDKKNFAFTGDLGNSPSPILQNIEYINDADYMVMESVYGDRNHENREDRRGNLMTYINEGIKRGGTVVIPAFSIERTQVLLYELNNMVEDGEIPSVPIYLDSPLAEKVTEIYKRHTDKFNDKIQTEIKNGDDIFSFPKLTIVHSHNQSIEIEKEPNPKIILAGSGMSEGGRIVNHEIHSLSGAENTVILVGYQAIGTLGRHIEEGLKEIKINNQMIPVRAKIEKVSGYSSHADSDALLEFVAEASEKKRLKKAFVIMGEPKSSLFLVQKIRDNLDVEAIYPEEKTVYEL